LSINQFLKQLGQGDQIKDFKHASKLFVSDNFRLAPRQGFSYHVYFELNPEITRMGVDQQKEFGMLVKSVDLPKFTVDTKTLNSYNKPNIVQTKIKYDQITITFHDDHADVVRSLWFDYYNYYYRDADLGYADQAGMPNPTYYADTKYKKRDKNQWGYSPRAKTGVSGVAGNQFIKAIRLYSMAQKRFAEYTLINPTITSFRHGQHQAGSSDPMQHEMTIAFETVLYAAGWVNTETVKGFGEALHYDRSPSPLTPAGGGTKSILGPGGLIDIASSTVDNIGKKDPAAAFFTAFRGYQNLKNTNLKDVAKAELTQLGTDVLRGNNPLNRIFVPNTGNLANGTPIYEYGKNNQSGVFTNPVGGATSNGGNVGSGSTPLLAGVALAGLGASVLSGNKAGGLVAAGGLLLGSGALNKLIKIDPSTGKVDSVGELPSRTPKEAAILGPNITGSVPVSTVTAEAQNQSTAALDNYTTAQLGSTTGGYFNTDGSVATTDVTSESGAPSVVYNAQLTALATDAEQAANQRLNPSSPTQVDYASSIASENPMTAMNNDILSGVPTNQGYSGDDAA